MESIVDYICSHAEYAHLLFFCMLMLAGLNVPFSEDLILLSAGMIASTCIPEHSTRLFLWVYVGCYISAWEAYWIGRLLGPKLYRIPWFSHVITSSRVEKLNHFYERFGIFTFIVGRFIPGGVRNCLFLSAGLGRMNFFKFALRDLLACTISSTTLFTLGFTFSENFSTLLYYFKQYNLFFIGLFAVIILSAFVIFFYSRRSQKTNV